MDKKKKINIGLDIGITSVGWSIIDEDNNIVKMGVRLFDDVADKKTGKLENVTRRESRSSRRRIRRVKTRKNEFKNLILKYNWVNNEEEFKKLIDHIDITKFGVENPIELRVKALKQKITKEQLIFLLYHYLSHRGYFYLNPENEDSFKIIESSNEDNFMPSEQIYDFYLKNHYYKDSEITKKFSARNYEKEIRKIFEVQEIKDKNFIEEYLGAKIFFAVRDFATGPGSEKSPTPYGLYYLDENNKLQCKGNSLWEALIGKCTYYPEEKRGGKHSPIAELFNLINDINNINFITTKNKIDIDLKTLIWNKYNDSFNKGTKKFNLTPKELDKLAKNINYYENKLGKEIEIENIKGYRTDGKEKPIITELNSYTTILNWMKNNNLIQGEIDLFDLELLLKINNIFDELSKFQDIEKRLNYLKQTFNSTDEENLNLVKKLKGLTQTHSLSYKAMLEYIKFIKNNIASNDNQMSFFENKFNKVQDEVVSNSKYISKEFGSDVIISPTARRAFTQTINVMNKILKTLPKEFEIDNITLELARDKNSAKEKSRLDKIKNNNEKLVKEIIESNNYNKKINAKQALRLKLWEEQSHRDIYDGQELVFNDVLKSDQLEVDHIIPYSISNDDSFNNKILTKKHLNSSKGNQSPYEWLSPQGKFEDFVKNIDSYLNNKKKSTLLKTELDAMEIAKDFIGRNLVDTRYASKLVLNRFQNFFNKSNNEYGNVKVKVLNGSVTNFARYQLLKDRNNEILLHKNRDVYCHHAIDASIVCWLGMNNKIQKTIKYAQSLSKDENKYHYDKEQHVIIDNETGEIIDIFKNYQRDEQTTKFAEELAKYNMLYDEQNNELVRGELSNQIQFSRMYTTKNNVSLSNETIYSFKWNDKENTNGYIIKKINLVPKGKNKKVNVQDLANYFQDNGEFKEKLLCFKEDPILFKKLQTIFNQYFNDKVNPFIEYMKVEHNIENPKFIQIGDQRVRSLRLRGDNKNSSNIIVLKEHENNAILESLNSLEARIYKNDDGKYLTIPINQKVLNYDKKSRKLIIDENKLNDQLSMKNISNKNYILFNKGTILINKNTNDLYYYNGGTLNINRIEIKPLIAKNEILKLGKQYLKFISTIINDFDIAEMDELGNIYNRHEIVL